MDIQNSLNSEGARIARAMIREADNRSLLGLVALVVLELTERGKATLKEKIQAMRN